VILDLLIVDQVTIADLAILDQIALILIHLIPDQAEIVVMVVIQALVQDQEPMELHQVEAEDQEVTADQVLVVDLQVLTLQVDQVEVDQVDSQQAEVEVLVEAECHLDHPVEVAAEDQDHLLVDLDHQEDQEEVINLYTRN